MERFTQIGGTGQRYFVSTEGKVIRQYRNGKVATVKQRTDRAGYRTVRLFLNGKSHTRYVHRLVAESFLPNEQDKPEVNHINGDKTDNRVENLDWVTHAENIKHAHDTGLIESFGRMVLDKCTGRIYWSVTEAAKALDINPGTCRNYLNGNIKKNKTCLLYAKTVNVQSLSENSSKPRKVLVLYDRKVFWDF